MKKGTQIGKKILENADSNIQVDIKEVREEITSGYMGAIEHAIKEGEKTFESNKFFVHVLTKVDRITKAITNYFHARESYPAPNYDQALYKYDRRNGDLVFLWVIPSEKTLKLLYSDSFMVNGVRSPLTKYCVDFMNGKYLQDSIRYNRALERKRKGLDVRRKRATTRGTGSSRKPRSKRATSRAASRTGNSTE